MTKVYFTIDTEYEFGFAARHGLAAREANFARSIRGARSRAVAARETLGADLGQGYSPFLYTSAEDSHNTGDDLDYLREKLEKLGLVLPESMYRAVEEDATRSNRYVEHFSDGRMVER